MPVPVTIPDPVPALFTVRVYVDGDALNVAVTDLAASIVTWHVPVPLQAPDQPAKVEPESATAVRVT